jgi:hypothetical protein
MQTDHAQKLTPAEMQAALAAYTGPIKKIPEGKRTTRAPSKKPGQSGDRWRVDYTANLDNEVYSR